MKKIFLILIILFLNGCGYTPLYSSKDSNYKVISLKKNVNNSLTNYVQNSIEVISNENAKKSLNISFDYNENISVILKNSKGDPTKNRLNVVIDLSLLDSNDNLIASKQFSESFEYNIDDNKFNLKQYEKNIKFNLIEDITQQILVFLANV
ncbi:hypothetical protein OA434_03140 [Candidatus Pelagibacter sp.]|nr:hypothetical protein [Candidatus Pelagibacter sp.]